MSPTRSLGWWAILAAGAALIGAAPQWAMGGEPRSEVKGHIVVGSMTDFPPYEFLDEAGNLTGFTTDLTKAIAKVMNLDIEFHTASRAELRQALGSGQIDVMQGLFYTREYDKSLDFSSPHSAIRFAIFSRKSEGRYDSLEELRGKEVIVVRGSSMHDQMGVKPVASRLVAVENSVEAVRLLASGKHDCLVLSKVVGTYHVRKMGLEQAIAPGDTVMTLDYGYAVREGDSAHLSPFDQGLAVLKKNGEYQRLHSRWLDEFEPQGMSFRTVLGYAAWVLAPLLAILALALLWTWSLRRQVLHRTVELRREVADRSRAEESLRRASAYNRGLIEVSLDPLVTIGPDGKITDVNRATESATGCSRQQLIGTDFCDYFTAPELVRAVSRAVFDLGAVHDFQLELKHAQGRVTPVLYNATVYRDEAGHVAGIFAAARDMTEIQRAEAEKEHLQAQLLQAQKMEAIGRLAGGVAHDFNNMMTVVTGFGRRALRGGKLAPDERTAVEQMVKAGERATNLTRQLLAFGRKQILQPTRLDLNDVVEEMHEMLPTVLGEDVKLTVELQERLWPITADHTQISQVIMNLAANARDAMPQGGTLRLRTANVEQSPAGRQDGPNMPAGRYVRLEVSDTGMGMREETRRHLFEPFFTTKEPWAGTGLGLSSVYGIVSQSGGHIEVDSAPGKGATFKIYFPESSLEDHLASGPNASEAGPAALPGGSETILLAEDEESVCDLVAADLRDLGYQVMACRNVAEALQAAETPGASIDLLLTDVVMDGIGGRKLAEMLTSRGRVRRVLYMSGHTEKHIVNHGVLERGLAFLSKPFTGEALAQKVREVLDLPGS